MSVSHVTSNCKYFTKHYVPYNYTVTIFTESIKKSALFTPKFLQGHNHTNPNKKHGSELKISFQPYKINSLQKTFNNIFV